MIWSASSIGDEAKSLVIGFEARLHVVALLRFGGLKGDIFYIDMLKSLLPDFVSIAFTLMLGYAKVHANESEFRAEVGNGDTGNRFTVKLTNPIGIMVKELEGEMLICSKIPADVISPIFYSLVILRVEVSYYKSHLSEWLFE